MLQNVSKEVREYLRREVRDYLRHAEDCAHLAKGEPDPNLQRDYLMMERRWLSLARSYQFSEQLDTFSCHNKKQRKQADDALSKLTELAARMIKNSPNCCCPRDRAF